jgi:hypothetical protein
VCVYLGAVSVFLSVSAYVDVYWEAPNSEEKYSKGDELCQGFLPCGTLVSLKIS